MQIRIQGSGRIIDVAILRLRQTFSGAGNLGSTIHPALYGFRIQIALRHKCAVAVVQIIGARQRDRQGLNHTGRLLLVEPVAGLDVVLDADRRRAAGSCFRAQALKQIIGRAILLHDNNHVLKVADLVRALRQFQPPMSA